LARWSRFRGPQNTQIYEGTNQIQRMVMARNLLRG
jgi:alkylation response protein AidB-like acyl-CoA dehydrogenase